MTPFQIVLVVVLPVTFLFVVSFWLVAFLISRKYHNFIFNHSNPVRSILIDTKEKTVSYFDHNEIKNVKRMPYDSFLSNIFSDDIKKFNDWVETLTSKKGTINNFLDIDVFSSKNHKKYHALMKFISYDADKKKLHIDSYLLPLVSASPKSNIPLNSKNSSDTLTRLNVPTMHGYTINFFFTVYNKNGVEDEMDRLTYSRLKEAALLYASSSLRSLFEISNHEFVIFDNRSTDVASANNFAHEVVHALNRFLEINSIDNSIRVAVGIVANSQFPKKVDKLISISHEMSLLAKDKNILIVTYNPKIASNNESIQSEIEDVIKEQKISYLYAPIYDVKRSRIAGYVTRIKLKDSSLKSISDLYSRAINSNENRKLINSIVKDAIGNLLELNPHINTYLFLEIKFVDYANYLSSVNKIDIPNNLKLVLTFDEYDVSYYLNNKKEFKEAINKIKDKKVQTCLKLSDKSLVFENTIYQLFDNFIVNLNAEKFNKTGSANLSYRIIVEKLLKFNRPIILNHVEGWAAVELLVRSGIEYIVSNSIVQESDELLEVSNKTVTRIKKMLI